MTTVAIPQPKPTWGNRAVNSSTSVRPNLWKGLVANYDMGLGATGTTLHDASLTRNNGVVNGATWGRDTLSFNGSSDYVSGVDFSAMPDWSVVAHCDMADNGAVFEVLLGVVADTNNTISFRPALGWQTIRGNNYTVTEKDWGATSDLLGTHTWLWGVRGTTAYFGRDGDVISKSEAGTPVDWTDIDVIGRDSSTFFEGSVGSIAIYDRLISASEYREFVTNPHILSQRRPLTIPLPEEAAAAGNPHYYYQQQAAAVG